MTTENEAQERVLICGTNWLGDSVMTMPAVQAFRAAHAATHVTMLVKPSLVPLWDMHPAVDRVLSYRPDSGGTLAVASLLREADMQTAYIFPNSVRSALIPYLARIPRRRGYGGRWRRFLMTDIITHAPGDRRHQSLEYVEILQLGADAAAVSPLLPLAAGAREDVCDRFGLHDDVEYVGLIPGTVRGPSKCWPEAHFIEVGRQLVAQGRHPLILGAPGEEDACGRVARACGAGMLSLAGSTSLPELAAVLAGCRAVLCNDSGGMHVASAVGCPVVAVFGLTDPAVTGPLGPGHEIVAPDTARQSRDIPRESAAAEACLRAIRPERALAALMRILERDDGYA